MAWRLVTTLTAYLPILPVAFELDQRIALIMIMLWTLVVEHHCATRTAEYREVKCRAVSSFLHKPPYLCIQC